ncbi:LssY C-terminal domain-containing protein [Microbacterium resistens]|nr:LssY C-terminal domain-containing protein [Microbacterium resistens]
MSATDDHHTRRRWAVQMQQPLPPATVFDRVAFLIGTASAVWLAVVIAVQGFRTPWAWLLFIPVWAILAYLALPRLHRMLSDLYVPDYFFGRTRTADGLLGDPVNLGADGSAAQLDAAMSAAGWHRADEITAASTWGIIASTLTRRSYPTAPVSPLMLFGRRHDVAYQQEVAGNPKQRHHVRFWHTPEGWLLPGGARTDWLGAGTYDTDVGLSFFTLQVTHRIDENTDVERDHVVSSLQEADPAVRVRLLHDFTTGYHARNGGGDRFVTDGNLPIVDLTGVAAPTPPADAPRPAHETPTPEDVVRRMPLAVAAGAVIVMVLGVIQLLTILLDPDLWEALAGSPGDVRVVTAGIVLVLAGIVAAQVVMAVLVLRRGRRARAILIVLLTLGILTVAIDYLDGSMVPGLDGTLLIATLQCVALLALSSDSAGAWVRRTRRRAR